MLMVHSHCYGDPFLVVLPLSHFCLPLISLAFTLLVTSALSPLSKDVEGDWMTLAISKFELGRLGEKGKRKAC